MTDQADLPQDLLDAECPDCGRILAAPPYIQLSSEELQLSVVGWSTINELLAGRNVQRGRITLTPNPDLQYPNTLSSEPDLLREAVKALEEVEAILAAAPLDGFRRYTYKLTMAEANRAVGLVRDIKAKLTARLSSPAPAQGEVDAIARMVALTELRRQISTEGRNWFRDRECVGPIDYQGIDIAEIVRVAIAAALHPQQEAQARPVHRPDREHIYSGADLTAAMQRQAARPAPHHYSPSTLHMGDCAVCGNLEDHPNHDFEAASHQALEEQAPQTQEIWARALLRSRVERMTLERAARVAEHACAIGEHGYRLESDALKQSIAATIRGLAPAPQAESRVPGMDWKISAETEAAIAEIDENRRLAALRLRDVIVGAPAPQGDEAAVERVAKALHTDDDTIRNIHGPIPWDMLTEHQQNRYRSLARAAIAALHEAAPQLIPVRTVPRKPFVYDDEDKVGEFHADYSELTAEEIAQPDPGAEVMARSKIIAPLEDEAAVERVARALALQKVKQNVKLDGALRDEGFVSRAVGFAWSDYVEDARAAIAALHEAPQASDRDEVVRLLRVLLNGPANVGIFGRQLWINEADIAAAEVLLSRLSTRPQEKVRQSLAYMRLFTAVRAWMKKDVGGETEIEDAMNAIDALSTRPQEGQP